MQTEAAFNCNYSTMSKLKSNELGAKAMNGHFHTTSHSNSNHLNSNHLNSNHLDNDLDNDLNNNSSSSNSEATSGSNGTHSDDQHLDTCILHQLEFYFSRENLLHDKYLVSQMDSDNYVSIWVVCQFNKIKKLFAASSNYSSSSDEQRVLYIQQLVKGQSANSKLQLDSSGSRMRANHKRCVVILREIDKETPVDAILNIFEQCPVKCLNCEFAASRSWYLTFKDEPDAQVAVQFIKEQAQTFNDEPLFARIKTNPIPRVNSASGQPQAASTSSSGANEQDRAAAETEADAASKHVAYSLYPAYYYPPEFPFVANPWMFYPSAPLPQPPSQFYPNFSKTKQASNEKAANASNANVSSTSSPASSYVQMSALEQPQSHTQSHTQPHTQPQPPLMFSYAPSYPSPAYKRKHLHNKSKAIIDTTDTNNSSQNEDVDDNTDKRNQYNRRSNYNMATYNQNFIILPNPASFGYASPPHLAYPNVAMYSSYTSPHPALHHQHHQHPQHPQHHYHQQQQQQHHQQQQNYQQQPLSSSSSSTSSVKPCVNQSDAFKTNQFKVNRFNGGKKYAAAAVQSPRPNGGDKVYDSKERSTSGKYSKLNGGRLASSYRKNAGRNGANRRDDLPVQFDYEPNSFPPLNDTSEHKVELEVDCDQFVHLPQTTTTTLTPTHTATEAPPPPTATATTTTTNELTSAWSRKSFAEIVKIPTNTLSQEIAKVVISED